MNARQLLRNMEDKVKPSIRKQATSPLIYFWDSRSMYLGPLPDVSDHKLAGAALLVGVERPIKLIQQQHGEVECRTALVPAGCEHETHYGGAWAGVILLEPESNDYAIVQQLMTRGQGECLFDLKNEDELLGLLGGLRQKALGASEMLHQLNRLIYVDEADLLEPKPVDRRIRKAMDIMRVDPAQSHSLESLAEQVYLSPTRFTHLFKEETGVPIRRYRQWHRFKLAMQLIVNGQTMTRAALATGFTDSAHFSRAFRSMFGLKPSELFRKTNPIKVIVD